MLLAILVSNKLASYGNVPPQSVPLAGARLYCVPTHPGNDATLQILDIDALLLQFGGIFPTSHARCAAR